MPGEWSEEKYENEAREILNALPLDFRRDCQTQEEYLDKKIEEIKAAIREYLKIQGFGDMLGLSGGIDSFAAAALAADAVKEISGVSLSAAASQRRAGGYGRIPSSAGCAPGPV